MRCRSLSDKPWPRVLHSCQLISVTVRPPSNEAIKHETDRMKKSETLSRKEKGQQQ